MKNRGCRETGMQVIQMPREITEAVGNPPWPSPKGGENIPQSDVLLPCGS